MMLNQSELRTLTVNRYEPAAPSLALHSAAYEAVQRAAAHLVIPSPSLAFFAAQGRRDCLGWTANAGRVWLWVGLPISEAAHIAAHEVVHAWQLRERGSATSMEERDYREGQSRRLASALCRTTGCTHGHPDPAGYQRQQDALERAVGKTFIPYTPRPGVVHQRSTFAIAVSPLISRESGIRSRILEEVR